MADVSDFIERSPRNRAKADAARRRVATFAREFVAFAQGRVPSLPFFGNESLIDITLWLDELEKRGYSIPGVGRYSMKVPVGSLGVVFSMCQPAVLEAVSRSKRRLSKSAPPLDTEFAGSLERAADDKDAPSGFRRDCSLCALLIRTSLRVGCARFAQEVSASKSALFGVIANNKDKSGNLTQWATPLEGLPP